MSLCIFLVKFNVPSTRTWLGGSFKVVNGVILMVVTRISRRLVLVTVVHRGARNTGKKTITPVGWGMGP